MATALSVILIVLVSVLAVWLYWKRCRWWEDRLPKNIARTPGISFPLIGDLHKMLQAPKGMIQRGLELVKPVGLNETLQPLNFWMGEIPYIMIFRAEDNEVLMGSAKAIFKPGLVYEPVKSFFGDGLITLNGDSWLYHRKVLTPVFHFKILEKYVDVFERRAGVLVEELSDPKIKGLDIDVLPYMTRAVSQTICETAFGMSEKLASRDEVRKRDDFLAATETAFKLIEKRVMKPWLMVNFLFRLSPYYSKQKKAEDTINEYALRIIRMKKEEIAKDKQDTQLIEDDIGSKKKVAFLDLVLRDSKNLLSEDEILQEVRTLVTVQQTTATTISFIFVMLAIHQDVQETVFREIQELDANPDDRSTYERLGELKYLERVIKETMRLYPVTALFSRELKEDLAFSNFTVPAGCGMSMFVYLTHRDKRFYGPDPERFDPDHFLPERCRSRHPYAYVPFSAGPRNCIGQKYAMLQMKAVVSTVVRSLHLHPGTGCQSQSELKIDMDTFLHIVGGFNVRFEPRF